ncbi:DNA alkylation repair protein [Hyalangium rubrum]|uniref:DNA alkylation repair protein n=1 Tax=Hyalangium rubrum TaxID=3103134 RepID=A0ABU5HKZ1_9BACT|nr:DNA alkylation repair protein [Hyalangium sp. s54d21]MDY7232750.1 DNA alkylation repair protein [Hyalangium sp. s54d21]
MAEALKTFFDEGAVRRIAAMLRTAWSAFPERRFVAEASEGLGSLELMDRARHIKSALHRALPTDFEHAANILVGSLGPGLEQTEGHGMSVFLYLPHVLYVAEHGLGHFEPAMRLQYELTQRFTAEFSIRPYLERYPRETLARLRQWARDPSVHVRRLVSEGTRPRLPWAPRLRAYQRDPAPVLELLELLKDDPESYVQRSVANNLNDIGKDHPDLLVATCERWSRDAPAARGWIIRHALRSAVKRGDRRALALLGFEGSATLDVTATFKPKRVSIGQSVQVTLHVANRSSKRQKAMVDLVVHFIKARGTPRPKVFKGGAVELAPGAVTTLQKTVSLADLTTRQHYPGTHRVEALVNGLAASVGAFTVTLASREG